ncbi:MAG: tyrosine-type recombinase/integrase [Christensenellales bacterium]
MIRAGWAKAQNYLQTHTWIGEYCGHLKESTLTLYRLHIDKIIKPALGSVKLTALTGPSIQAFCNSLQRGDSSTKPKSPKSIKNIHGVLHRALQQAVELSLIRFNPADVCKLPRVARPTIKPLDEADIARFLDAIKGKEYEREFVTALFTGMRQAEILGLTWDCIDFQRGTIHLYHQLQLIRGEYKLTSLKMISPAIRNKDLTGTTTFTSRVALTCRPGMAGGQLCIYEPVRGALAQADSL